MNLLGSPLLAPPHFFAILTRTRKNSRNSGPTRGSIKDEGARSMKVSIFWFLWVFVFLAAAYDSYFAYSYREVLDQWEVNPLVRRCAPIFGLPAVFGVKAIGLGFAAGLATYCRRRRLKF